MFSVFKFLRVGAYRRGEHAHRHAHTQTHIGVLAHKHNMYKKYGEWLITMKSSTVCVIRVPEGKKRENGSEFEFVKILTEHFLKVKKDIM